MWLRLMLAVAVTLGVGMSVSPAAADTYTYDFSNDTYVRAFQPQTSGPDKPVKYNGYEWHDYLGTNFQSFGADINFNPATNQFTLTLYTNFNGSELGYTYPDLFFDDKNTTQRWDYAIKVSVGQTTSSGELYSLGEYKTSQDVVSNPYHIFGGQYDQNYTKTRPADGTVGELVPVLIYSGSIISQNVNIQFLGPPTLYKGSKYSIVITWNKDVLDFYAMEEFLWGTGTCANDVIGGLIKSTTVVPLPGSVLLLGSGLLGLVALGRRIRKRR